MKTKILMTIFILIIAASMVVGGTMAYFSDSEVVKDNTFAAGKLDLELGVNTVPFAVTNVVPGQSGTKTITLTNTAGSVTGKLSVDIANIVQLENEIIEPEQGLNGEYTPLSGELGMFLKFRTFIDVNKDGILNDGDIQLAYNGPHLFPAINYPVYWKIGSIGNWTDVLSMTGGQEVKLVIMWEFPPESEDANYSQNIAMTDSLSFDINFVLNQAH